ncbi:MAG: hypothetical protein GY913_32150 [Proteobacteria bacterium]|nr:hypothetical protein [Pseudomonadota bacterium]MCP4921574.1 hypothetical protein [Pseudomonadota bacterium]
MIWIALVGGTQANPVNEAAKIALSDESGWLSVGTTEESVGTVSARHKEVDGVDCLEASAQVTVPVETLKEVVLDIPANLDWSSADLLHSVVLKEEGTTLDYVQVLDIPSPFGDRYWFLHGTVADTADLWEFSWEHIDGSSSYPDAYAKYVDDELVEVDVNVGSWAFLEQDGATVARFRSCTNVGGSVPRWAGEKAARVMLPNNIIDLVVEGEKRSE